MKKKQPRKQLKKVKKPSVTQSKRQLQKGSTRKLKKETKQQSKQEREKKPTPVKKFCFIMKDIRCFAGEQKFEIRPLTFLVGENSTGKTTALGCFNMVYNKQRFLLKYYDFFPPKSTFSFNELPYEMGSFDTIMRRIQKKTGNAKSSPTFELGFANQEMEYIFRFARQDKSVEPVVSHLAIKFRNTNIEVSFDKESAHRIYNSIISWKNYVFKIKEKFGSSFKNGYRDDEVSYEIFKRIGTKPKKFTGSFSGSEDRYLYEWSPFKTVEKILQSKKVFAEEERGLLKSLFSNFDDQFNLFRDSMRYSSISLAPVRSKPKRTYDFINSESYDSEGSDIPMLLMRLYNKAPKELEKLRKKLVEFGKISGLFSNIKVESYGNMNDPFRIHFQIKNVQSNIRDTGYGISQILPILVRLFRSSDDSHFLLQQPEVHLHPKAQAALSSLFIETIKTSGKSFLIETHSDYMVDRARIEIRKGNIPPDQVSLIYFESLKDRVQVHNISFDEQGNFLNAPEGYGKFFLKESDALLGFDN